MKPPMVQKLLVRVVLFAISHNLYFYHFSIDSFSVIVTFFQELSHHSSIMFRNNSVFVPFIVFFTITLVLARVPLSFAASLRGTGSTGKIGTIAAVERNIAENQKNLVLTNICYNNIDLHVRYFDGGLKYSRHSQVLMNQAISIDTTKKVTVALIAADDMGKDVFSSHCAAGEKGFIQYSDRRCYKYHYTSVIAMSCPDYTSTPPGSSNDVEGVGSIEVTPESPMC